MMTKVITYNFDPQLFRAKVPLTIQSILIFSDGRPESHSLSEPGTSIGEELEETWPSSGSGIWPEPTSCVSSERPQGWTSGCCRG